MPAVASPNIESSAEKDRKGRFHLPSIPPQGQASRRSLDCCEIPHIACISRHLKTSKIIPQASYTPPIVQQLTPWFPICPATSLEDWIDSPQLVQGSEQLLGTACRPLRGRLGWGGCWTIPETWPTHADPHCHSPAVEPWHLHHWPQVGMAPWGFTMVAMPMGPTPAGWEGAAICNQVSSAMSDLLNSELLGSQFDTWDNVLDESHPAWFVQKMLVESQTSTVWPLRILCWPVRPNCCSLGRGIERKERKQHNSMLNQVDSEGFSLGLNWFANAMHCWTYAGVKAHYFRSWPNLGKSEGIGLIPRIVPLSQRRCANPKWYASRNAPYYDLNIYLLISISPSPSLPLSLVFCSLLHVLPFIYPYIISSSISPCHMGVHRAVAGLKSPQNRVFFFFFYFFQ